MHCESPPLTGGCRRGEAGCPGALARSNSQPYALETRVPGVFVAGDVRKGSVKRLTIAAGEGAMAIDPGAPLPGEKRSAGRVATIAEQPQRR